MYQYLINHIIIIIISIITKVNTSSMSIVITSDQLNLLIYKYLCECNLSHTAYSLFNEANLTASIAQYKYDMKPGQLLSILEKGLIFNQIQTHVTINEYQQCSQPFSLIRPHTCKITQKIKKQNEQLISQLNEQIFSSMRRTSSVHNTLIPNRQYQQIIYQQRSVNYLDNIQLRIRGTPDLQFGGNSTIMYAYDPKYLAISIIKRSDNQLITEGTLPCIAENVLAHPILIELADNLLIRIYEGNMCELTQINIANQYNNQTSFKHFALFVLPLAKKCCLVKQNPKLKSCLTFCDANSYCIINISNSTCVQAKQGFFQWKDACSYFVSQSGSDAVMLRSLRNPSQIQKFNIYGSKISQISVAYSGIYFFVESKEDNKIYVYTFEKEEPLYIFNFGHIKNGNKILDEENKSISECSQNSDDSEILRQCLWTSSNSADDLLILTQNSIKTFGIQLNNYIKTIDISSYDKDISKAVLLRKDQNQVYAIFLGCQNILAYDIALGKIERIQYQKSQHQQKLFQLQDIDYIGLKINNNFYLAKDSDFQSLFL